MLEILDMMPTNWDDQEGWDRYYEAYRDAGLHLNKIIVSMNIGFQLFPQIEQMQKLGLHSIWLPGCGVSLAPKILAHLGADVWASDFSRIAVAVQHKIQKMTSDEFAAVDDNLVNLFKMKPEKYSECKVFLHDFRIPYPYEKVDCILNVVSFQALPRKSMISSAKVHYESLRSGGHAFFITQNVQGEHRENIEDCLTDAGFQIPHYQIWKAYRYRLQQTGISYIFRSDRPMLEPLKYQGEEGRIKAENDMKILQPIIDEFEIKLKESQDRLDAEIIDGTVKVAHLVYNTG
jgi:hypothetical protein